MKEPNEYFKIIGNAGGLYTLVVFYDSNKTKKIENDAILKFPEVQISGIVCHYSEFKEHGKVYVYVDTNTCAFLDMAQFKLDCVKHFNGWFSCLELEDFTNDLVNDLKEEGYDPVADRAEKFVERFTNLLSALHALPVEITRPGHTVIFKGGEYADWHAVMLNDNIIDPYHGYIDVPVLTYLEDLVVLNGADIEANLY